MTRHSQLAKATDRMGSLSGSSPFDGGNLLSRLEIGGWQSALERVEQAETRMVSTELVEFPDGEPDRWISGYRLKGIITAQRGQPGTPAPGALDGTSVVLSSEGRILERSKEYLLDEHWGGLGLSSSMTNPHTSVTASYKFGLRRLDSLATGKDDCVVLVRGMSHLTTPLPPALDLGQKRLANVYVPYGSPTGYGVLFPIREGSASQPREVDGRRLRRAAERVAAGLPLRVTCWGDSVTDGGDSSSDCSSYPAIVERNLKAAYRNSDVQVSVVAVGGSNSNHWLGGDTVGCDWSRVAESEPDVITVEFVNDAELTTEDWNRNYVEIARRAEDLGADLVLSTPHWVMPSWMRLSNEASDRRPYVSFIRLFAQQHDVVLADVSQRWESLVDEGIPYETMLNNGINHPDDRGHALAAAEFVESIRLGLK